MNIVVCLKLINKKEDVYGYGIGSYDLYALKQALDLKEIYKDLSVICISMGTDAAKTMLKMSVALGSDRAVLISDKCYAGSDTVTTSYILGNAIRNIPDVALVFCGHKSFDGETGFIGPGIAQQLGVEYFVDARMIEKCCDWWKISTVNDTGTYCFGIKELGVVSFNGIETGMPVPSLFTVRKANKCCIEVWDNLKLRLEPANCGIKGSRTDVINISFLHREKRRRELVYDEKEAVEIILNEAGVNGCIL